ncbi:Outer membrane efflux protein [Candidatus Sulfopaludibacter sp. SbA6]|nr:Outer membrane efflux protein [Candidatus Sulfopaludibacter sp. SbA6]
MNAREFRRALAAGVCLVALCGAQDQPYIVRPQIMAPIRSYMAPTVPPIRLTNSNRLYSLIRGGNLYLTLQDAIALAIENNLNLEIARYGPLLADAALERAKAGGPYRGVPSGLAQISSVDSGLGVNGSAQSAGLNSGNGGGGGGGGGSTTIQQVGQATPNLDAVLQSTVNFSHLSQPQPLQILSQTNALIESVHTYNSVVQQGLLTGGTVQFRDYEQYLKENSGDQLNPAVGPFMNVAISQPLLQGFGIKLNDRDIRRQTINTVAAREQFRAQLLNLVASVANLYWDLVGSREELNQRRHALDITQKFRDDTKYEISVGAIAPVDLPRAEADFASRRQDAVIAQNTVRDRSIQLKEALSHTEDPILEAAEIIPLDRIEVPDTVNLPALRELVASAMAKRPDVAASNYSDQMAEINLAGTTNPLLPSLRVQAVTQNRGVAGTPQAGADPYFAGGYGTAMGQVFRRNFPTNQVQVNFSMPIGNRVAQADYGIDQLQFQQSKLSSQRDTNKIVVDIAAQISALRQARARYATARDHRVLQEELLAAERKKSAGVHTYNAIMTDQRALIAAQLSEVSALTSYAHAQTALDQVLGLTLETYHITLDEGLGGHVTRESTIPDIAVTATDKK